MLDVIDLAGNVVAVRGLADLVIGYIGDDRGLFHNEKWLGMFFLLLIGFVLSGFLWFAKAGGMGAFSAFLNVLGSFDLGNVLFFLLLLHLVSLFLLMLLLFILHSHCPH